MDGRRLGSSIEASEARVPALRIGPSHGRLLNHGFLGNRPVRVEVAEGLGWLAVAAPSIIVLTPGLRGRALLLASGYMVADPAVLVVAIAAKCRAFSAGPDVHTGSTA